MMRGLVTKAEGRRGSQRRLQEGGAIWVFPETAVLRRHWPAASETTIAIRSSLSVQETGCGTPIPVALLKR